MSDPQPAAAPEQNPDDGEIETHADVEKEAAENAAEHELVKEGEPAGSHLPEDK